MDNVFNARISEDFFVLFGMGIGLVAVIGTFAVLLSIVTTVYRRKSQKDDMEATLKMEMIQRSISAEDIERVLSAKMGSSDHKAMTTLFNVASASKGRTWNQPVKQS